MTHYPHRNGWVMTCGSVYGDPASPRFAGIWAANTERVAWNADGILESSSQYQARYDAQVSGFARPAFVTRSDFGTFLSIFRDDAIGPLVARQHVGRTGISNGGVLSASVRELT